MKKMLLAGAMGTAAAMSGIYLWFFDFACNGRNRRWSAKPKKSPDPETAEGKAYYERQKRKQETEEIPYEDAWLISRDHLQLHARYYPNENAERIVILCHGFHGSVSGDFAYILPMLKRDCEILAIDERAHGRSEGKYITYGAKEKLDIHDWADFIVEKNDRNLPVYLFGVSMGAASVLMNADQEPAGVKGIIADCGYTTMHDIILDVQKAWYKTPEFPALSIMAFNCHTFAHFEMKEADALSAMKNAKLPVLFFHGSEDHFVKPSHTEKNAAACASKHRTVFVEGAGHAVSSAKDPQLYESEVRRFFAETESEM
ncbi:MAG: alpha/beta hydrolase [Solobacterium sp.]|nr:alpha/beta hydrolase [Solobacterium sp.]